ncbi:hypothetical protein MVEN_00475700 [Mycena venus]|uniref:Uncharacterized protein n=1 Tax=Mycena venus TaxID=2733690 RepID=A0A8H7DBH8_9AGAR|nr:hypothetical protein MVEN_00475700 [Mycena venus]
MTTPQDPVMVILKCPAHMSMDVFTQKCEDLMHAIIALPCAENISKYDLCVPNRILDAHLERLGMPIPQGTIVLTSEFPAIENLEALARAPEMENLIEAGKADVGWHLQSCTFAYDMISKIGK